MPDGSLAEQARGLRADVGELAKSVKALADRTEQSERTVKRIHRIAVGLVLSLVLTVGLTACLVFLGWQVNSFAHCQAEYNTVNNQRTRALTEATAKEREADRRRSDALDAVFLDPALLKPNDQRTAEDQTRIRRLFVEYLDAAKALRAERARADAARAANPVPPPPSTICT